MGRGDLTNGQCVRLEPLSPQGIEPGRPPVWTRRQLIDGIRWRTRTSTPPERYGPWDRVYDLFRRWQRDGTWARIVTQLQAEADAKGLITWDVSKIDERQALAALIDDEPHLAAARPGLLILADKGYIAADLDRLLAARGISLLRPSYRNRGTPQPAEVLLKTVRQLIESVNDTLNGQLDLEQHGGRTVEGLGVRVAQRILAMTCAIWHNRTIGAPVTRSLIAYDH